MTMSADPIVVLDEILKRNGCEDVDLRNSEVDRYFLFDQITDPADLDLAWSQFPVHEQIRARADEIDTVSDIMPGWGYRTPKKTNRCSDQKLIELVGRHLAAMNSFLLREDYNQAAVSLLDRPYCVEIVSGDSRTPPEPENNELFGTLYEAISEFRLNHVAFEAPIEEVLHDWAIYLTKCNEVALYLLWPMLVELDGIDPHAPDAGFALWSYGCRDRYWIKENDPQSGIIHVQPPWLAEG
jgi:hypothetical protein